MGRLHLPPGPPERRLSRLQGSGGVPVPPKPLLLSWERPGAYGVQMAERQTGTENPMQPKPALGALNPAALIGGGGAYPDT